MKKLINVCEKLVRAEDMLAGPKPPVFLRLAGNDGWVFDRRGMTMVCEDVTAKSRCESWTLRLLVARLLAGKV